LFLNPYVIVYLQYWVVDNGEIYNQKPLAKNGKGFLVLSGMFFNQTPYLYQPKRHPPQINALKRIETKKGAEQSLFKSKT